MFYHTRRINNIPTVNRRHSWKLLHTIVHLCDPGCNDDEHVLYTQKGTCSNCAQYYPLGQTYMLFLAVWSGLSLKNEKIDTDFVRLMQNLKKNIL